MPATVKILET